jgi:hypothetical protein
MATLVLENVPEDLLSRLQQLAESEHVPVTEKTVSLLQQAVGRRPNGDRSGVQEILDRLVRNRFRPDPGGPSVVEMLREDRER